MNGAPLLSCEKTGVKVAPIPAHDTVSLTVEKADPTISPVDGLSLAIVLVRDYGSQALHHVLT